MIIPTLETERLLLRGHRLEDFDACAALWGDPVITRHIGGKPSTREEVWARVQRYLGHWQLLGFGFWLVREKATGAFVGEVGLADFKRTMEPSIEGMPEAGWVLAQRAHGKGYATEAVRAALAWGDAHFGSTKAACIIDPENRASLRVAEKCGFVEWTRTTYKGDPAVVLRRA
ncbi:MAG: GNAT family N-acetyltransferase [Polyangiales bacterium]